MEQKSFKERVRETVIQNAFEYKKYYVEYEYLLCSRAFTRSSYYIVSSHKDNYLHLTGLHTHLDATSFFDKCYSATLQESDFDFYKKGQNEKEVKGSVRRKINSLPNIMNMFAEGTLVEEDFEKNKIRCALAAGNESITLGFVVAGKAKPMTLLKGNELDITKSRKIDLVLRRKHGKNKFSELILGESEMLTKYRGVLENVLSEELLEC